MENNSQREQEFFFRDFFFHILYHWRSILVAALIGAILLGGVQYVRARRLRAGSGQAQQVKAARQDYQSAVEGYEANIDTYTRLIKQNNDYLAESPYMQLDPQNVWACVKTYFVRTTEAPADGGHDPADGVSAAYVSALKSGLDDAEMEALLGTSRGDYIDELVTVSAAINSNSLTLRVIGPDRETVERRMAYFDERLKGEAARAAQAVAAHELVLVGESVTVGADANLVSAREALGKRTTDYESKLSDNQKALSALQSEGAPAVKRIRYKRDAAIGFIIGAAVLAAVYAALYLLGGRLHMARELTARYGLPLYGAFAAHRARRPRLGIDKWLDRWEFCREITDPDVIGAEVCALLRGNYAGRRVLLTGAADEAKLAPLADRLRQGVAGAVEIDVLPDLPHAGRAHERAGQADGVILVAQKYCDRLADIDRMTQALEIANAQVGGCIAL